MPDTNGKSTDYGHGNLRGAPPDGSPYQCQAKSMHTGQKCRKWALKGRNYCQMHGGRNAKKKTSLGFIYTGQLGPKLSDRMNRLLQQSHEEQVQLYEELALMRVAAQEAVRIVSATLEKPGISPHVVQLAFGVMTEALGQVRDFALAVSKIEKETEDKVSIRVIDLFIVQVMSAIRRVCGDDSDIVARIRREIDDTVRIPEDIDKDAGSLIGGTYYTPDQLAAAMDASVVGDSIDTGMDALPAPCDSEAIVDVS